MLPQQSPINLCDPIQAKLGDRALQITWPTDGHAISGKAVPNDHGLKIEFSPDTRQFIMLDGSKFFLRAFHFHHPSEHWIDGEQFTIELHIVHQCSESDELAVVGIFIEPSDDPKPPKNSEKAINLLRQIKSVLSSGSDSPSLPIEAVPGAFIPDNETDYYRYEGSLTTPPYSENVKWVVMKESYKLPVELLNSLIPNFGGPARFPQAINRRFVLCTFDPTQEPTSNEIKKPAKGKRKA